jgi:murein DD-endopeptidase MepM/ murein hydrolase activator NlpD/cell wall-associated NlpC family hydrolase
MSENSSNQNIGDQIAANAKQWAGRDFKPGETERCQDFVNTVLNTTKPGLADQIGTTGQAKDGLESGQNLASRFFGDDKSTLFNDISKAKPGDLVAFKNTYGDYPPGTITHVGVYVGDGMIVDRSTSSHPVNMRSINTFGEGNYTFARPHVIEQMQSQGTTNPSVATPSSSTTTTVPAAQAGSSDFGAQLKSNDLSKTPIYLAIGLAEGTIGRDGSPTSAYGGHQDPGNNVLNKGFGSYQVHQDPRGSSLTAQEADRIQADRLAEQWPKIDAALTKAGFQPGATRDLVAANALDAWNQAPATQGGRFGLLNENQLSELKQSIDKGASPTSAITNWRAESYKEDSGTLNAPGLGNSMQRVIEDQGRRVAAVNDGLHLRPAQNVSVDGHGTPAPTQTSQGNSNALVREGDKNDQVKHLQEQLIKTGITTVNGQPFTADGDFGPNTRKAVETFQAKHGLDVDGVAGPKTFGKLNELVPQVGPPAPAQTSGTAQSGTSSTTHSSENGTWPVAGRKINAADKEGEGEGVYGSDRAGGARKHQGVDIEGNVGDRVGSFASGTVLAAGPRGGYGNTVIVQHDDGKMTLYAHLDGINVKPGQKVGQNEQLGTMGRTGNTPSTGDTHLHFEMIEGSKKGDVYSGTTVDPMKYLNSLGQNKDGAAPAAPSTQSNSSPLLREGDKNDQVKHLQEQLIKSGVTTVNGQPFTADGDFGPNTRKAVETFQAKHGLDADGVAGPKTFGKLNELVPQVGPPAPNTAAGEKLAASQPTAAQKLMESDEFKRIDALASKLPAGTFKNDQQRLDTVGSIMYESNSTGIKVEKLEANPDGSKIRASQGDHNTTGDRFVVSSKGSEPLAQNAELIAKEYPKALEPAAKVVDAPKQTDETKQQEAKKPILIA